MFESIVLPVLIIAGIGLIFGIIQSDGRSGG